MGIMDEIKEKSDADRIKFEREQEKRVEHAKAVAKDMEDKGVPDSKRPV